jgi:hypothetical protein
MGFRVSKELVAHPTSTYRIAPAWADADDERRARRGAQRDATGGWFDAP